MLVTRGISELKGPPPFFFYLFICFLFFQNRISKRMILNTLLKTGRQRLTAVAVETKNGVYSMPRNLLNSLFAQKEEHRA